MARILPPMRGKALQKMTDGTPSSLSPCPDTGFAETSPSGVVGLAQREMLGALQIQGAVGVQNACADQRPPSPSDGNADDFFRLVVVKGEMIGQADVLRKQQAKPDRG